MQPLDSDRWRAVLARDPAQEGRFVYAVTTTQIYCRPTCPARRPNPAHVRFFTTPAEAAAAGFRPCRRCQPDQASNESRVVAQVEQLIREHESVPSLAELGEAVGMSPSHLQRLFKRATGLSPREWANQHRAERLKGLLREGAAVTESLYAAGYGSSRALYEQAGSQLGMTPGAYRRGGAGERIAYGTVTTGIGAVLVAATAKGVCALLIGEGDELVEELRAEFPRAALVADQAAVAPYLAAVQAYLAGGPANLELPLDVAPTAFQARVWAALRAIPPGETRTYSEVAAAIGAPTAIRAVGRACATNPVSLAIPCHRVVRTDGSLSGYRWGLNRKQALLEHEGSRP